MTLSDVKDLNQEDIKLKYNIDFFRGNNALDVVWFVPTLDDNDVAVRLRRLNISRQLRIMGHNSVLDNKYYWNSNEEIIEQYRNFNVFVFSQFDKREYELMLEIRCKIPDAVLIRDHCEAMFDLPYESDTFRIADSVVCSSSVLMRLTKDKGFTNACMIPDSVEDVDYSKYLFDYRGTNKAVFMGGYNQSRIIEEVLLPFIIPTGYSVQYITENPLVGKKWNRDTWIPDFLSNDVSLCVQPHWGYAKSNVKVVVAMAFGIPVLASDTEAYKEIIEHGKDGFICSSLEDWNKYLIELKDIGLRREIGKNAKIKAEKYSISNIAHMWVELFLKLLLKKSL